MKEPSSARKRKLSKCHKRELTEAEVDALFENGQFGVQDPKSLQRAHGVPDKMEVIKERLNRKRMHTGNKKSRCTVEFYKFIGSHHSEAMLELDASKTRRTIFFPS